MLTFSVFSAILSSSWNTSPHLQSPPFPCSLLSLLLSPLLRQKHSGSMFAMVSPLQSARSFCFVCKRLFLAWNNQRNLLTSCPENFTLSPLLEKIRMKDHKTNPSFSDVRIGDVFTSNQIFSAGGHYWFYISTVINMEDVSTRFGKPDRIVSVRTVTNDGKVVDTNKKIWVSQLLQGLV